MATIDYDPREGIEITSEQADQIYSRLPKKKLLVRGEKRQVYYDSEKNIAYLIDPKDGETWTSEFVIIKPKEPNMSAADTSSKKKKSEQKRKKTKVHTHYSNSGNGLLTILLAVANCFFLIVIIAGSAVLIPRIVRSDPAPAVEESVSSSPTAESITVLSVTEDILPGTQLTDSMVKPIDISLETYNTLNISGSSPLCTELDAGSVIGQYIISYIPKGQYLVYDNIGTVYEGCANPFMKETGFYQITLPSEMQSPADLCIGEMITLEVTYIIEETAEDGTISSINKTENYSVPVAEIYNADGIALSSIAYMYFGMYETAAKTILQRSIKDGSFSLDSIDPLNIAVFLNEQQYATVSNSTSVSLVRTNEYTSDNLSFVRNMLTFYDEIRSFIEY